MWSRHDIPRIVRRHLWWKTYTIQCQ